MGSVRFATSKELSDHSKDDHDESMGGTKPYRCALDRCGKGWKVSLSPSLLIQWLILSSVEPRVHLAIDPRTLVSVLRASMGCNITFKCNPPSLMLISPQDVSTHLLPSDPRHTSVRPSSISIYNSRSKGESSLRTVHPPPATMRPERIRGTNVKSILVHTMGAQISTARKAVSVTIYPT